MVNSEITALVVVFPEAGGGGGGLRAVGGGIGDFLEILQRICSPVVEEIKGL